MRNWMWSLPLLLFAGLCLVLLKGLLVEETSSSVQLDKPMPVFNLASLADPGIFFTDQDIRNNDIFLVNFWASWCAPCYQEHLALIKMVKDYSVRIVGINYKDDPIAAKQWLNELGNPYTIVLSDSKGKAGIDWGIIGVPETFLVDAQGMVRYKHTGPITINQWEKEIWPAICQWSNNHSEHCIKPAR